MVQVTVCRAGNRCALLALACFCLLAGNSPAHADSYPRADAAATSQRFAATLDESLRGVLPLLAAIGGTRGQVAVESLLGDVFRAIDTYANAEAHLQRAQRAALAAGHLHDAARILTARGEIALLQGDYTHAEGLSHELVQLAQREHLEWAEASAEEYLGVLDRRHGKIGRAS